MEVNSNFNASELGEAPTSEQSEFRTQVRRAVLAEAPAEEKSLAQRSGNSVVAKHGRGRKPNFRKYLAARIDVDAGLGTLVMKTVTSGSTTGTVIDTARVSSIKCTWTLSGFTAGDNIGPIICGVAHPDYSSSEIEAWLENSGSWDLGNKIQQEIAGRRIRLVGVFDNPEVVGGSSRLNDGRPITTKLNWILVEGDGLRFWSYNSGTEDVATTIPNLNVFGKANIWMN